MNRFSTRVVVLFALVATFPVALTGIVWLAVSQWGAGTGTGEAEMARTQLDELDAQRKAAVSRLCRDDLAVDTLLRDRSKETPSELDYDRLFRGSMEAAGLQALWVLDSLSGDVIATDAELSHGLVAGRERLAIDLAARDYLNPLHVVVIGHRVGDCCRCRSGPSSLAAERSHFWRSGPTCS